MTCVLIHNALILIIMLYAGRRLLWVWNICIFKKIGIRPISSTIFFKTIVIAFSNYMKAVFLPRNYKSICWSRAVVTSWLNIALDIKTALKHNLKMTLRTKLNWEHKLCCPLKDRDPALNKGWIKFLWNTPSQTQEKEEASEITDNKIRYFSITWTYLSI